MSSSSRIDRKSNNGSAAKSNGGTVPLVTRDPRFVAGRTMVQSGPEAQQGAIEMFATLLEETNAKYGDTSIEAAACFYEYGNALFRAAVAAEAEEGQDNNNHIMDHNISGDDPMAKKRKAAAAAELRAGKKANHAINKSHDALDEDDRKPAARVMADDNTVAAADENVEESNGHTGDGGDDVTLALEMMETAWSILDSVESESSTTDFEHDNWIQEQLPRILMGLGDVLLRLERHGDAVDTYLRALPYREEKVSNVVQLSDTVEKQKKMLTLAFLKARRQLAELYVLIAETLLTCPTGSDIVTTETKEVLVRATEREDYVQGYYDKSRDMLQETVLLLGQLSASSYSNHQDGAEAELKREKENVCFVATLLMGVGEQLAEIDENKKMAQAAELDVKPPVTKKKRRTGR